MEAIPDAPWVCRPYSGPAQPTKKVGPRWPGQSGCRDRSRRLPGLDQRSRRSRRYRSARQPEAPSSLASRASTTRRRAAGPGRTRVWRVYSPRACRHGRERRRSWPGGPRSQTPADRRVGRAAPGRRLRAAAREPGAPARSPPPTQNVIGSGQQLPQPRSVAGLAGGAGQQADGHDHRDPGVPRCFKGRRARRRGRLAGAKDGNQASRWAVSRRSRSSSSSKQRQQNG
jgi:hypothetical protein